MGISSPLGGAKQLFHQVYWNHKGGPAVHCGITSTPRLVDMALSADAITVRQEWPNKVSAAEISRLLGTFGELMLDGDPIVDDPEGHGWLLREKHIAVLDEIRRNTVSQYDRHLLVGYGRHPNGTLLLLVLTPTNVGTCIWQL